MSILISQFANAQVEYVEVGSEILNQKREIKIQLPRNYENSDKSYPVIVVLDGDYMFEPFAGNVDYLSYWEIIPEAFVVGINQIGYREEDGFLSDEELPTATGADFFEFIGYEVLKFMDDNYRTSPFAVIAGIDLMANYSNFYLLKENPLFRGYINLSPDLTPLMPERIQNKASKIEQKIWYYLATGEDDIPALKKEIVQLDELLAEVENSNFTYQFDVFDKASHFSLVANAIPDALNTIFKVYRPISDKEYQDELLKSETPVEYLEDKYFLISELYAIEIPIRVTDFLMVADAIEENENWEAFKDLSRLAKKETPETVLSTYFEGRYYQEIGKPKKAIKAYQGGYGLKSAGYLNSDTLLEKADELKRIFGY